MAANSLLLAYIFQPPPIQESITTMCIYTTYYHDTKRSKYGDILQLNKWTHIQVTLPQI